MKKKSLHLIMRLILVALILVPLGVIAFSISFIFINQISDLILSLIALFFISSFALVELVITLVRINKPMGLEKTVFTSSEKINPIPLIGVILIALIGLAFTIPGIVLYFVNSDLSIKSYSLVILSLGIYILNNCVFYFLFVLSFNKLKKQTSNQ